MLEMIETHTIALEARKAFLAPIYHDDFIQEKYVHKFIERRKDYYEFEKFNMKNCSN